MASSKFGASFDRVKVNCPVVLQLPSLFSFPFFFFSLCQKLAVGPRAGRQERVRRIAPTGLRGSKALAGLSDRCSDHAQPRDFWLSELVETSAAFEKAGDRGKATAIQRSRTDRFY
jgi:hypothetical protein